MTEIERKALALALEVRADDKYRVCKEPTVYFALWEALCRAIEQHEAFRLEVSDAVRVLDEFITGSEDYKRGSRTDGVHLADGRSVKFARFIIAKPDPLVEAVKDILDDDSLHNAEEFSEAIRAALAKRGLEIREKE